MVNELGFFSSTFGHLSRLGQVNLIFTLKWDLIQNSMLIYKFANDFILCCFSFFRIFRSVANPCHRFQSEIAVVLSVY